MARDTVVGKKLRSVLARTLSGRADSNISFRDLVASLHALGFDNRVHGDHHIFWKQGIPEIINLQPKGSVAKAYQVKQVRNILLRYELEFDDE